MSNLVAEIQECEIKSNESIALHTSFKIGGPCDTFVIPRTELGIKSVIQYTTQHNISLVIIGQGTNVLFPDNRVAGLVMHIGEPYFCDIVCHELTSDVQFLRVGSGISISRLLEITADYGLSGLEFMAGIPGTLGGAIVMNAGAYGKRVGEFTKRVKVMNIDGDIYWLRNDEIGFGYRESRFNKPMSLQKNSAVNCPEIILEVELELNKEEPSKIKARIQEILSEREAKFPLEFPSAGCIFKNPASMPAGKLIELAGCKGLRIGGAQVSTKHANFIINTGGATYKDVKALIFEVHRRVYDRFKISLEPELIIF